MTPRQDPLDALQIPDGTTVEEHDVVTDGDILIGSNSTVDFGLRGRTIAAGERVEFGQQIEADGDCRLDMWCEVDGSVLASEDAYIGERVEINGQLLVSGDLDIGDDVTIEEGFEANGWIVTRNPVPALVFYFIILSQFLRMGDTDTADEFASALAGEDIEEKSPLVVPRGSEISDDAWRVSTPARIGDNCRLNGNIRAETIDIGDGTTVFGSLRARDDIEIGDDTVVIGDVTTRSGTITVAAGAHIRGDIACENLVVYEDAEVDGTLRARGEMKLIRQTETDDSDTATTSGDGDKSVSVDTEDGAGAATADGAVAAADSESTGPKMAYTASEAPTSSADDGGADTDASETTAAGEQPAGGASSSVGAAYTAGADDSPDSDTEPEAASGDDEAAPGDDEIPTGTVDPISIDYLVADRGGDRDTPESEIDAKDTDDGGADEASVESGDGGDTEGDDGTDDGAVIITDAESEDIEVDGEDESKDGSTDADS